MPAAFVVGMAISTIELACTGQVYLPAIIVVFVVPKLEARTALSLLLYNLLLVVQLVVVSILAHFGPTSEQLGQFINRRAATI